MTARAISTRWNVVIRAGWPRQLVLLGVAWFACLWIYQDDARAMVSIWWSSSSYGHCLLIPLIIAWLVQQRAAELKLLTPMPWWPGLLWIAAGGLAWLLGDAASLALARHAGLILMLQGAVLTALGPAVSRGLAFPLAYAFFLVPFGEEFVPVLQMVTAHISMFILGLSGIPAYLSGVFISTPTGYFEVAEACSGAKFLIAMAAYAALVCNLCFKSWPRRLIFLLMSLAIAVLANGIRAFGTIYVAHLTSSDFAVGFDHVVYGWVFFAVVLALVMAAGWPLFDRRADEPFFDPDKLRTGPGEPSRSVVAIPLLLALLALPSSWSATMAAASEPVPDQITLPEVPGWTQVDYRPAYPWEPRFAGADHQLLGRYRNAKGREADLAIAVFARQEEGRELVGFGQGAVDPDSKWAWSSPVQVPHGGHGERIVAPGPVTRHVASYYSIGGTITGSSAGVKLQTLKARLLGRDQRAVAILISAEERDKQPASAAIQAFLHDLGPLRRLADQSAGRK
ncbi:exosortase A [Rhizorhapis sp.]|uniref:exosortase A n=1 Tax=Rhizorhapis sp. TaxID=1968842 RepID=UPI002B47E98D|nr:exosortase A [Rhizorhapis sp.]HKR16788.1 exosortase A [Rhizorhapis sp.]